MAFLRIKNSRVVMRLTGPADPVTGNTRLINVGLGAVYEKDQCPAEKVVAVASALVPCLLYPLSKIERTQTYTLEV